MIAAAISFVCLFFVQNVFSQVVYEPVRYRLSDEVALRLKKEPAYDDQMMRLAEILGSLHYLRALCGADEGQMWRDEMQKLIEAEEPVEARRAQLIASFNRGYRGYQEIYRECTAAASEAANRFLEQGMKISADIPNRYGR